MIDYIIKCHAQCKQPIRSSCFSRDQSFLTMSLPRCFTLIGDSNVRRHMNPTNCRDRPLMSGCQVLPCTKLSLLAESLKAIRSESTVCVLSCLTKVQTIGYKPRPLLKLTPPASASSDSRIQTYNFIQAVNSLPANFTSDEQAQILREISPKLYGRLRQTFVVISDDMVKKRSKGRSGSGRNAASGNAADGDAEADADGDATARSPASGSSGRGRGSNRGRGSRNGKRGPSPIPGGAEKHRK